VEEILINIRRQKPTYNTVYFVGEKDLVKIEELIKDILEEVRGSITP
jgi:hypothetical protein